MSDDEHHCPSCGTPMTKHMGIYATCAENIALRVKLYGNKNGPTATISMPILDAYLALVQAVEDHAENTPPIVVMAAKRCLS